MNEIIKEQFLSGKALVMPKYNNGIKRELWPTFNYDLYPVNREYYHELNPYYLCNLYEKEFFKFSNVLTVRDGYVTFADFLLKNITNFEKIGTKLFIIHPDLVPLVPQNIRKYFATWGIVQKNQITLKLAKNVIIFGLICENNIGSLPNLTRRLQVLKQIDPQAKIEVHLPLRKNMFEQVDKESYFIHKVMKILVEALPNRDFSFLISDELLEKNNLKDTYLFDLAGDNFVTSDNYLHYFVQSRGGSVNNASFKKVPPDSIFGLDLSLYHEFHVRPLPQVENVFIELLLYRKKNWFLNDFTYDPGFHALLRDLLSPQG